MEGANKGVAVRDKYGKTQNVGGLIGIMELG